MYRISDFKTSEFTYSMFLLHKQLKVNIGKCFQTWNYCCLTGTSEQLIQHKFLKQVSQMVL